MGARSSEGPTEGPHVLGHGLGLGLLLWLGLWLGLWLWPWLRWRSWAVTEGDHYILPLDFWRWRWLGSVAHMPSVDLRISL